MKNSIFNMYFRVGILMRSLLVLEKIIDGN